VAGNSPRVLFIYTVVGRGGDAVQIQAMSRALRRIGCHVALVGGHELRPYQFAGIGHQSRRSLRALPWWLRDLLELGLNLAVAVRALGVGLRLRPQLILERMTPYGPAGLLLSRWLRTPLVVHLDAPFAAERAFGKEGLFRGLHRTVVRWAGRKATAVAVGSELSHEHYRTLGVPPEKMVFVHNGVLLDEVVDSRTEDAASRVVGFCGSLARWHRVDLLLQAVARLRSAAVPVTCTIVGMGVEYTRAFKLATDLGLGTAVRFTGPVDRKTALAMIDDFQVAVLPGTLPTGSPMKLFDYAARRVPMVIPELPNLRQIWGEAAAYFAPGDAGALAGTLRCLLEEQDLRRRLADAAWARLIDRYTWERQMAALLHRAGVATPAAAGSETT